MGVEHRVKDPLAGESDLLWEQNSFTMARRIASHTYTCSAALANDAAGSQPIRSTIWSLVSSIITIHIDLVHDRDDLRSCSMARYRLEMVCAWIPCVQSTSNRAPSQAAMGRIPHSWKSTCPGINQVKKCGGYHPAHSPSEWRGFLMVIPRSRSMSHVVEIPGLVCHVQNGTGSFQ